MNKFKQLIKDEIVEPSVRQRAHASTGKIIKYKRKSRKADIEYKNPNDGSHAVKDNVPITKNPPGFHEVEPEPGDRVFLIFESGDPSRPRIVGIFDETYNRSSGPWDELFSRKGALNPKSLGSM